MLSSTYIDAPLKLACAAGLLFFSGCFRVGMPEYVSSGPVTSTGVNARPAPARLLRRHESRAPFALILSPDTAETSRNASLGHQYLLGIIPFTRVFLQHGVQSLAEESAAQILSERGYRVLVAPAERLSSLAVEVPLGIAIGPRIERLRVNAFDALIVRLADISGLLTVEHYSPQTLELLTTASEPLEEQEYRRHAHAPALAQLTERTLRSALEAALKKAPSARQARVLETARSQPSEAPLWILSPTFSKPPAPALGQFIAATYGFDSVPPLRPTAVLRIVQRGMEACIRGTETLHVSALAPVDESLPLRSIRTDVQNIGFDESGDLVLEAGIAELHSGIVQRSARCTVREAEASGADGAAIVTLERAAGRALAVFLGMGDNFDGVNCL